MKPLTLNELLALAKKLEAEGHGDAEMVIWFDMDDSQMLLDALRLNPRVHPGDLVPLVDVEEIGLFSEVHDGKTESIGITGTPRVPTPLTLDEAAKVLNVTREAVAKMCEEGIIKVLSDAEPLLIPYREVFGRLDTLRMPELD